MAKILPVVKNLDNYCVYNFGGFVAPRVLNIIKECNFVIPCLPSYNSFFFRTVETIEEIKQNR
jgi:hypothetical protein